MLPSEAVATLQLQGLSVDVESDMLLVPFAQGQFLPFCLFYICSFHIIITLVAEQFEGEFNQLEDAVNESKGTLVPVSEGHYDMVVFS